MQVILNSSSRVTLALLPLALLVLVFPVHGQISQPCSASMLSSFTPCLNFLANSTANGTSPTYDCCNAIRSLTSGGKDCLCLIVTGGVPFQIPINRTLAISLPRACNTPGVPLQCKAAGAPIPAPGPIALGPSFPPEVSPSAPEGQITPAQAPGAEIPTVLTPPSSSVDPDGDAPTTTAGSRPVLTPSSATSSMTPSFLMILGFASVVFKFY